MYYYFIKFKNYFNKQSEIKKITFIYRYVSLMITTLFNFINNIEVSNINKAFIFLCILLSSIIFNYLYFKNDESIKKIKIIIFIETIGNVIILIPSGGLKSSYVWYSLNSILMCTIYLNIKLVWANVSVYLIASIFATKIYIYKNDNILVLLFKESNLILSFILITGLIILLIKYIKRVQIESTNLERLNIRLSEVNKRIKDSINYSIELYQLIHLMNNQNNIKSTIELVLKYIKKLTESSSIIYIDFRNNDNITFYNDKLYIIENKTNDIKLKKAITSEETLQYISYNNKNYLISKIKSNYIVYGAIGIEISDVNANNYYDSSEQLKFITEICLIIFEKIELERVNERIVITEEQNRIANEIHDSVLQRLFSISCSIYSLTKRKYLDVKNINHEIDVIRNSINTAMKDLRNAIYGLSWKKSGSHNFINDIQKFISDIENLNKVDIDFNINGDIDDMNIYYKKSFYRIICEGIGNAIRHGRAKNIYIDLNIVIDYINLIISDNGEGFDINYIKNNQKNGLGIRNMNQLIKNLNGKFEISSNKDEGTCINIKVPNIKNILQEEVM